MTKISFCFVSKLNIIGSKLNHNKESKDFLILRKSRIELIIKLKIKNNVLISHYFNNMDIVHVEVQRFNTTRTLLSLPNTNVNYFIISENESEQHTIIKLFLTDYTT